jgi:hypothetical protein
MRGNGQQVSSPFCCAASLFHPACKRCQGAASNEALSSFRLLLHHYYPGISHTSCACVCRGVQAAGFPSWKAMQREAKLHEHYGTQPIESTPHMGVAARNAASNNSHTPDPTQTSQSYGPCGECDIESAHGSMQGGTSGFGTDSEHAAFGVTNTQQERAAAKKAGFSASHETTHGLTTEELRAKLAAAGVGLRMATSADLGARGLW